MRLSSSSLISLLGGVATLVAAAPTLAPRNRAPSVWDRSIHGVYALSDHLGIPSLSDQQWLDAFDEADATAVVPFFLNVLYPDNYTDFIHSVTEDRGIVIVPGIGRSPDDSDIDTQEYKDMATNVAKYTKYIRLENLQGFFDKYGKQGIQNLIDHCVDKGFEHIMMNPWPRDKNNNGVLVDFENPECDCEFDSVIVRRDSKYVLRDDPENWHISPDPIAAERQIRPGIPILINYESPGPQTILTNMEKANPGSSYGPFNVTYNDIIGQYKSLNLHWAPPITQSYDAITLGTWSWIAGKLKEASQILLADCDE